jgi:arginyl-tRNA synthetase
MNIEQLLKDNVIQAIQTLYDTTINEKQVQLKQIPKEVEGDYSIITFPFAKQLGKNPNEIAAALATQLLAQMNVLAEAKAIKGFCNLSIGDAYWTDFVGEVLGNTTYGHQPSNGKTVVIEYSSPNTNKPLHLGHIRNNLLGYGTAQVLAAAGYEVKKVQIVNDRGVHICKSMLAWQKWGNGETPTSTDIKGDHLVGKYYVLFEKHFQVEYKAWQTSEPAQQHLGEWLDNEKVVARVVKGLEKKGKPADTDALGIYFFKEVFKNKYFNQYSGLGLATKAMLQQWESGDEAVRTLWQTMNGWVYAGFEASYKRLGVDFDKLYYESETYLTGRQIVLDNLAKEDSIFFKKEDGSVWIDLTKSKLDEKVVLRSDGTSMYITQDIGTATLRFADFGMDSMVYVVANEQDYHFKVLFKILEKLGHSYAKDCHHLSYGMVNLTSGRMKSREGTVVDADDLMDKLVASVQHESESRETLAGLPVEEQRQTWEQVALGALKFYILKVEPKKSMTFDPKQSIELQGQTGPYIQNAHVRTQSVQRMVANKGIELTDYTNYQLEEVERDILILVHELPNIVLKAAKTYNPAEIANYLYDLAKAYHKFWNDVKILDENNLSATSFRLDMSKAVAQVLRTAGALIGMQMPNRM